MRPLVHAIWRARMAALLRREGFSDLRDAWTAAGRPLWQRYRDAGLMPQQALTQSGAVYFA